MKKMIAIILLWCLFTNASDKTEWYITIYDNYWSVNIKVKRSEYLEHKELFDMRPAIEYSKILAIPNRCKNCGREILSEDTNCNDCKMEYFKKHFTWEHSVKYKNRKKYLYN